MVRDDHVDVPDHHRLPEQLLVVLVTDWWTALLLGGSWRDLCRAEVEVVVAGLHCQLETLSSSSSDQRQGGGGREMDDVTGNSSEAANINHQLDCCRLHGGGSGGEKGGVKIWVSSTLSSTVLLHLTLSVEEQDGPGVPELRQSLHHLVPVDGGELVNSGVDEETLEPGHSHSHHLSQVGSVSWNDSPPELDIDPALSHCSLRFHPEVVQGGGGWGLLSGMSTSVVTPPAAAAMLAVLNPS